MRWSRAKEEIAKIRPAKTMGQIAQEAGVSLPYLSLVLSGERKTPRVCRRVTGIIARHRGAPLNPAELFPHLKDRG